MASTKDYRQLLRKVKKQGFDVEQTKGGHVRVTSPCGELSRVIPCTASDFRAIKNSTADLKKIGFRP